MKELNCSNLDSTIASLAHILDLNTVEVLELCKNREVTLSDPPTGLSSVVWFHATRIPKTEDFREGLLSTPLVRSKLIDYLGSLAISEGLCTAKDWGKTVIKLDSGEATSEDLTWKHSLGKFDDGPHGFLVREVVTNNGHIPIADYTREPEYINCICSSLEDIGDQLLAAYRSNTSRAIVPFRSSKCLTGVLSPAMEYVRTKSIGRILHHNCNTSFSGEGVIVAKENVLPIEWLRN